MTIIEQLIHYGHLLPGSYSSLDDSRVIDAIERYRNFLQLYTLDVNSLFSIDRCGRPDFEAVGSGSWPKGCNPDNPAVHSVLYYVNDSRMPLYLKDSFEESWDLMRKAYADVGLEVRRSSSSSNYNSLVTFERGRGWIGLAIVGRGQTCRTRMWAKFDTSYGSSFSRVRLVNQWAFLLAHELGHNCGMSHTRGGIMNASLINGTFHLDQWRRSDPALPILTRYYDGNPIVEDAPIWTIPAPEQPRE